MTEIETQASGSLFTRTEIATEARSSGSDLITAAALGFFVVVSQHHMAPGAPRDLPENINAPYTQGTAVTRSSVVAADVMRQMHRVYDELLASQVDLDDGAKRILHENRWDLYE